jgi:serine/threonine-protein kinase RsbW
MSRTSIGDPPNSGVQPQTYPASPFVELEQSLPSKVDVISPFVDQLVRFITKFRRLDGSEVDIEIAVREAITNAVIHGNQEDRSKRVYVTTRCSADGEVSIIVRDEGPGFDVLGVSDPTARELSGTTGRGIRLMRAFMDEVHFEQRGTILFMRKTPNLGTTAPEPEER